MAQAPDRIRDDIQTTRDDLARDVDMLADRTLPNRVVRRRWTAVRGRMRLVSERVMGTPGYRQTEYGYGYPASSRPETAADRARSATGSGQGVAQRASDATQRATETVQQAPEAMRRQTQGNPFAAGLIAFGAGLLTASLIPASEAERRAGQRLQEEAGDLMERVREPLAESGRQIKDDVSGSVRQAADQVKETARDAARTTAEESKGAARDAARQTRQAT
jgi:gas vesicle protein